MNDEPLEFLALSDAAKTQLRNAEFAFAENVLADQTLVLRESQPDDSEYLERLRTLPAPLSCCDMLKEDKRLSSGSETIDKILNGGFRLKAVTELCGLSGTGKTQLSMQLSVMAQLPAAEGGLANRALVIDSNYGFTSERYNEILSHFRNGPSSAELEPLVIRVLDMNEMLSALQMVRSIVVDNKISVLIVDSFSRPFLFEQISASLISTVMTELQYLASNLNLAVIVTTQLTSKMNSETSFKFQTALKSDYSYYINERLFLYMHGDLRKVSCSKNLELNAADAAEIKIDSSGVH